MEVTNYLPFRCIIFINESILVAGVGDFCRIFQNKKNEFNFKGHEFSPLIYRYDRQRGTIEFLEKLDRQETVSGRKSIGFEEQ